MEMDAPRTKLAELIAEHDTDMKHISEKVLGKNHAYIQQYLERGSPRNLPEEVRELLGLHFGVDPDVFRAPPNPKLGGRPRLGPRSKKAGPEGKTLTIDELDVIGSNADGGVAVHPSADLHYDHERVVAQWQIPSAFLRGHTSAPAERIKIITAKGLSNAPLIMPGDKLLVDIDDRTPSPSGFFALWDGFGEIVKHLEMASYSEPPRVTIKSTNRELPLEDREMALSDVTINGRVIGKWMWT